MNTQAYPALNPLETPTHLSFLVPDSSVEVFALYTDKVIPRVDDATFSSNGPGCVNVITSHHPHRDACTLTLTDGLRHLGGTHRNTITFTIQVIITYYGSHKLTVPAEIKDTHTHRVYSTLPQAAQGPLSQPQ